MVTRDDFFGNEIVFDIDKWKNENPGYPCPTSDPEDRSPLRDRPDLYKYCFIKNK